MNFYADLVLRELQDIHIHPDRFSFAGARGSGVCYDGCHDDSHTSFTTSRACHTVRRQLCGWQRMEYESVVAVRRCKREFFECLLFAEQIL